MPLDPGLVQILRDDLAGEPIRETRMFGGIAFMRAGHMVAGVHGRGVLFRVGKPSMEAALALPGARPMTFTGRPMAGFVDLGPAAAADDATRSACLAMALAFVRTLPAKPEKPARRPGRRPPSPA